MKFNTTHWLQAAKEEYFQPRNHEGAAAYAMSPEMELYSSVVTASFNDQFYETGDERMNRLYELIAQVDPVFVAKLAIYAREKMYLRSVPLAMAVLLGFHHSGDALVSTTVRRVVQRADEITELLACYAKINYRGHTKKLHQLSKQIQKGLAQAFNKFDEYQFAKYDRKGAVTLRDALFLVHPKAKDEAQQLLFNKIAQRELATPYTWETTLSALGQQTYKSERAKKDAFCRTWEMLISTNALGYMATLRNLRNMLAHDVSKAHIKQVCAYLSDEAAVLSSKQLPFRFLAAYRELKSVQHGMTGMLQEALEAALKISVQHLKGFDANTKVVVACDVSGSMQRPVSGRSKILCYDIGLILGMLLQYKSEHVLCGMFGDTWKTISLSGKNILANVDEFYRREGEVGYATNGHKVLENLIKKKYVADKIMFFTDCQLWDSQREALGDNQIGAQWIEYKKIAPRAKLYLFDLGGYGKAPLNIHDKDIYLIGGWSDKVFEVLDALEKGEDALAHIQRTAL